MKIIELVNNANVGVIISGCNGEKDGIGQAADAGFLDLSFANVPLKYGRHVPRGLMVYLETKTWKVAELQSGAFADLDGSTLHRTGTTDEWNGYYRWYYNLVCVQPNANAILCGINYPA